MLREVVHDVAQVRGEVGIPLAGGVGAAGNPALAVCPLADGEQVTRPGAPTEALAELGQSDGGLFGLAPDLLEKLVHGIGEQVMNARFVVFSGNGARKSAGHTGQRGADDGLHGRGRGGEVGRWARGGNGFGQVALRCQSGQFCAVGLQIGEGSHGCGQGRAEDIARVRAAEKLLDQSRATTSAARRSRKIRRL